MSTSYDIDRVPPDLQRADCPAYTEALARAFADDPSLAAEPDRAAALAADLYAAVSADAPVRSVRDDLLRLPLLQRAVAGFEALPWMHRDETDQAAITWGITAIVDLAGLSECERALLRELFCAFDYHEDTDLEQASFVAFTSRHSEPPRESYQTASLRLAQDGAEALLLKHAAAQEERLCRSRSAWWRLADRAVVAFG